MIHAYVAFRGKDRTGTAKVVRHAVEEIAHLCGAHDTVCGRPVLVDVGPWSEDDPRNCQKCSRLLAGTQEAA